MSTLFHLSIRVPKTVKRKLEKIARYEGHDSTSLVARTALGQYVLTHQACTAAPLSPAVFKAVRVP